MHRSAIVTYAAMGLKWRNHCGAGKRQRACMCAARACNSSSAGCCAVRSANTTVLPSRVGLNAHMASAPNDSLICATDRSKLEERPNKFTTMHPRWVKRFLQWP